MEAMVGVRDSWFVREHDIRWLRRIRQAHLTFPSVTEPIQLLCRQIRNGSKISGSAFATMISLASGVRGQQHINVKHPRSLPCAVPVGDESWLR